MKTIISATLIVAIVAILAIGWLQSRPLFPDVLEGDIKSFVSVAPIDKAITFARLINGDVLLVLGANQEMIDGINLSDVLSDKLANPIFDGISIYKQMGEKRLREIASTHSASKYAWSDLGVPLIINDWHVGVGANYLPGGSDKQPFLFPKFSKPTSWNSSVSKGERLDYEVELCILPVNDKLGLVLCNDYTDASILFKKIDFGSKMGLTGVADAKGGGTRLSLGPLLVIPNNDAFYEQIEIGLYLNGALRQRSSANNMTWKPNEIAQEAMEQCNEAYEHKGQLTTLYAGCKNIPEQTLLLTGTPPGTMLSPLTVLFPWYYLRAGDVIEAYGTYLGFIENKVVN